jgi:hypothetical protein
MKVLTEAGRNKHGQRLVRVECSCGNIFEVIYNNIKRGRTNTCGHCGKHAKELKSQPAPVTPTIPEQKNQSTCERGTPAWYADQIASKEAAALVSEKHVKDLQVRMAQSESTDLDVLKKWTAETTAFHKLNQQIACLQIEKAKTEAATIKESKSASEIMREKIAGLK